MAWNTALDGQGNTYYWHSQTGTTQYEKPADFDPTVAQDAGSYAAYQQPQAQTQPYHNGGGGGGYQNGGGAGGYGAAACGGGGGGYGNGADFYGGGGGGGGGYGSSIGLQFSQPKANYKDVQDQGADQPANEEVAAFWAKHECKVYGNSPPPMLTFEAASLPGPVMDAVNKAGFSSPSVIQAQSWPAAMAGRDVIAVAKTGSGKTLGFLVPAFQIIVREQKSPMMGASLLVLAPTRELAMQIEVECQKFGLPLGIRSVCCYGGAPKGEQLGKMRMGCQVIIGTPGRINDFRESNQINFQQVSYLVMDEADRMLDMGFEPQIRKIVAVVPPSRQTLFYTATWPRAVRALAYEFLRNPVQVEVGDINSLNANKDITQVVHLVSGMMQKQQVLSDIFKTLESGSRVIIFTSTKRTCDQLGMTLNRQIGCGVIHGDKDQRERENVLTDFKSGKRPVMIATDVAARGIDVKDVKAVVNFDFPGNIEDYIHRIGRTGRAGAKGIAHTFMDLGGKDGNKARPLVEIMMKAEQQIPAQLAQAAGVRTGFLEADMGALMRPVEGQGMLNPDAARMAAQAPSSGATYGGYSRQPGDTSECDEERVGRMLVQREQARKQRNYQLGDQIRDQMRGMGIEVDDASRTWRIGRPGLMGSGGGGGGGYGGGYGGGGGGYGGGGGGGSFSRPPTAAPSYGGGGGYGAAAPGAGGGHGANGGGYGAGAASAGAFDGPKYSAPEPRREPSPERGRGRRDDSRSRSRERRRRRRSPSSEDDRRDRRRRRSPSRSPSRDRRRRRRDSD